MPRNYVRKDAYYKRAKEEGYRSRAAYKLLELNKKYRLIKKGSKVLDLGAWPGGWLQVAAEQSGPNGSVVGIDLVSIDEFMPHEIPAEVSPIILIQKDVRDEDLPAVLLASGAPNSFDVILSDMSPKLSGIRFQDVARAAELAEIAVECASRFLRRSGSLVMKVFPGEETETLVRETKGRFATLDRVCLDASRNSSTELYLVGRGSKTSPAVG
jgi:23S rRNA (uridine2552-2'-O)-methyltransferase